jgi:hypothetical protein
MPPRTKIYLNDSTKSFLTNVKNALRFRSYDETVVYLSSLYVPPPDPIWINRIQFCEPIKPGRPTHTYQHLPLDYESIKDSMRPSMRDNPPPLSHIVREEFPDDGVGKARVKYVNKSATAPVNRVTPPANDLFDEEGELIDNGEEFIDDDEGVELIDDEGLRDNISNSFPRIESVDEHKQITTEEEERMKNRFDLRSDK